MKMSFPRPFFSFQECGMRAASSRQLVIQHRAADFERIRHRHAIHLHQHVAGELCGGFKIERLRERIGAIGQQSVRHLAREESSVGGRHPLRRQQALAKDSAATRFRNSVPAP